MLVELSVVEQRYRIVLAVVVDRLPVTAVAAQYGISRQTVHSWLARYHTGGLGGLVDRRSKPTSCPHQMAAAVEVRLVDLRREHPRWGPTRLRFELSKASPEAPPGRSSIYRALVRNGLIEPVVRRRRRVEYRRWERTRPMELWQMDVVGFRLANGLLLSMLSGIDDHSRFCVCAAVMARADSRSVCAGFNAALQRHGIPDQILTDNGKVFTGRFGLKDTEVLFDRICRENGIDHLLTAPRSPTTTGKIERFHRTLRSEFLTGRVFDDLGSAQGDLDRWVASYNTERPHQGIAMATPASRFVPTQGRRPDTSAVSSERSGEGWISRKVAITGIISVAWQQINCGRHRAGHRVDVHLQGPTMQVWDGDDLLKTVLRDDQREVRKKHAAKAS